MEKHRYVLQVLRAQFNDNITLPSDLIFSSITSYHDGIPQTANSDYASYQGLTSFAWSTNESILHLTPCSCHNSSPHELQTAYPLSSPITLGDVLSNTKTDDPTLQHLIGSMQFITVEFRRIPNPQAATHSATTNTNTDITNTNKDDILGSFFLSTHDRHGLQLLHIYNHNAQHIGKAIVLWFPMLPQMLLSLPTYQQPEKKFFQDDNTRKFLQRRTLLTSFLKLLFKPTFPEDSDVYNDYWEELHGLAKDLQEPEFRAMFIEQLTPIEAQSLKALATGSSLATIMDKNKDNKEKENKKGNGNNDDTHGIDLNPPYLTHPSITSVFLTFLNMCLNLCAQTRDFTTIFHILQISSYFSYPATVLSALKGSLLSGKVHTKFLCNSYSISKHHTIVKSPSFWNFIYLESLKLCDALYATPGTSTSSSTLHNSTPSSSTSSTSSSTTHSTNQNEQQLFKHLFWSRRMAHISQPRSASVANIFTKPQPVSKPQSDVCPYHRLFLHCSAKYSSNQSTNSLTNHNPTQPQPTTITTTQSVATIPDISFAGDDLDFETPSFIQSVQYRLAHHFSTIHGTNAQNATSTSTPPPPTITTIPSTNTPNPPSNQTIDDIEDFRGQYERILSVSSRDKDKVLIIQLIVCTLFSLGQDSQQVTAFIIGLNLDPILKRIIISWLDTQQLIIEHFLPDRALYKELPQTSDSRWVHCRSTFDLALMPNVEIPSTLYPTDLRCLTNDFWVQRQSTPTTTLLTPSTNITPQTNNKNMLDASHSTSTLGQLGTSTNTSTPNQANNGNKLDWGREPRRPLPIHVSLAPPPDWTYYNEYQSAQHRAKLSLGSSNTTLLQRNQSNLSNLSQGNGTTTNNNQPTTMTPSTTTTLHIQPNLASQPDSPSITPKGTKKPPTKSPRAYNTFNATQFASIKNNNHNNNNNNNNNNPGEEQLPPSTQPKPHRRDSHTHRRDSQTHQQRRQSRLSQTHDKPPALPLTGPPQLDSTIDGDLAKPELPSDDDDDDYSSSYYDSNSQSDYSSSIYSDDDDVDNETPDISQDESYAGLGEAPKFTPSTISTSEESDYDDDEDEDDDQQYVPDEEIISLARTLSGHTNNTNSNNGRLSGTANIPPPLPLSRNNSKNNTNPTLFGPPPQLPDVSTEDSGESDDDFVDIDDQQQKQDHNNLMVNTSSSQRDHSPANLPPTPSRPKSLSVSTHTTTNNNSIGDNNPYQRGRQFPPTPSTNAPPIPIRTPSRAPSIARNYQQPTITPLSTAPTPPITTLSTRQIGGRNRVTSSLVYNPVFTSIALRRHRESLNFVSESLVTPLQSLGLPEIGELIQDSSLPSLQGTMHRRNALQLSTTQQPSSRSSNHTIVNNNTMSTTNTNLLNNDPNNMMSQLGGNGWMRIPFDFMHGETALLTLDVYCLDMPSILHYATRQKKSTIPTQQQQQNNNNTNINSSQCGIGGIINNNNNTNQQQPLQNSSSQSFGSQLSTSTKTTTLPPLFTTNNTTNQPLPSLLPNSAPLPPNHNNSISQPKYQSSPTDGTNNDEVNNVRWFPRLGVNYIDNTHVSFSINNNTANGVNGSLSYPNDTMMPTSVSTTQDHPHIEPDLEITVSSLQRILDSPVSHGRLTLTNYRLIYSPYVYISNTSSSTNLPVSNNSISLLPGTSLNPDHNCGNTTSNNNNNNNIQINSSLTNHCNNNTTNNNNQVLFADWVQPQALPTSCNEPNCSRCIESRCRRVFGTIPLQSIHRLEIVEATDAKAKSFQLSILDEFKKIDQSKHISALPEQQQLALARNVSTIGPINNPNGNTIRGQSSTKNPNSIPSFTSTNSTQVDGIAVTLPQRNNTTSPSIQSSTTTQPQYESQFKPNQTTTTTTELNRTNSNGTSYSNSVNGTINTNNNNTFNIHPSLSQVTETNVNLSSPQSTDIPVTSDILFRLITQWCMGPQQRHYLNDTNGNSNEESVLQSTNGSTITHPGGNTGDSNIVQTTQTHGNESLLHIRCKDSRQVTFCIKHTQHGRTPHQLWSHFKHQLRSVAYQKQWDSIKDGGPRCPPHVTELAKRIETLAPTQLKHLSQFFHLYAFVISSNKGRELNGWDIYQPHNEFTRQGCYESGDFIEYDNSSYTLSPTYPSTLCFQWRTRRRDMKQAAAQISQNELDELYNVILPKSAKYRSKGRLPTVTFYHCTTGGTILRSAQPLPGITNSRSTHDQDLCNRASISIIFDARPKANAQANKMKGGGFEPKPELYNSQLIFCDIENIHKMRAALKSITTICREACPHVLVTNSRDAGIIHSTMIFQHAARIIATSEAHQRSLLQQQQQQQQQQQIQQPQNTLPTLPTTTPPPTTTTSPPPPPPRPTTTYETSTTTKPRRGSFASSVTASHSNLHAYTGVSSPTKSIFVPSATDLIARCGVKTLPERYGQLVTSEWAGHVTGLLKTARDIAQHILDGKRCLVRCSDGWDRTAQMCCLAQIMLDPYYRTINGFAVLIEKDFLSFGHKFSDRCGHADPDHANVERSPIFIQFLDAVFQLLVQNPTSFEFDDTLLHYIATHTYSCKYGTFLFNNHRERHYLIQTHLRTVSIWDVVICKHKNKFINPLYEPTLTLPLKKVFPLAPSLPSERCDRSLTEIAEQSSLLWNDAPWSPWNFYFRWDLRTCYEYKV